MLEFTQIAACIGIAVLSATLEESSGEITPNTVSHCFVALGAPTVAHGAAGPHDVRLHWFVPEGQFVGKNAATLAEPIRRDIEDWSHTHNINNARWSFRGWAASTDGRTIVVGPPEDSRVESRPRRDDEEVSWAFGIRVYSLNDAGEVSVAAIPDARQRLEKDGINIDSVYQRIEGDLLILRLALGTVVKAYQIDREMQRLHEIQLPDSPTQLIHHLKDDQYISLLTDKAQILTLDTKERSLRPTKDLEIPEELKQGLTNDYRDIRNHSATHAFSSEDMLVLGDGLVLGIEADSLNIIASVDSSLGELRRFTQARCCQNILERTRAFGVLAERNDQGKVVSYSLATLTTDERGTRWNKVKFHGGRDGLSPGSVSPDGSICIATASVHFGGAFDDPASLSRWLVHSMTRDGELLNESQGRGDGFIWICN